jgi:transcriptional regulator with XRE-family HTH domain
MISGEVIKKAREILGLSQAQLAKDAGMAQRTLSRWEQMESIEEVAKASHWTLPLILVAKLVANTWLN